MNPCIDGRRSFGFGFTLTKDLFFNFLLHLFHLLVIKRFSVWLSSCVYHEYFWIRGGDSPSLMREFKYLKKSGPSMVPSFLPSEPSEGPVWLTSLVNFFLIESSTFLPSRIEMTKDDNLDFDGSWNHDGVDFEYLDFWLYDHLIGSTYFSLKALFSFKILSALEIRWWMNGW